MRYYRILGIKCKLKKYEHVTPFHNQLNILKLKDLIAYKSLQLSDNVFNNLLSPKHKNNLLLKEVDII